VGYNLIKVTASDWLKVLSVTLSWGSNYFGDLTAVVGVNTKVL